jgi:hypothetical protein
MHFNTNKLESTQIWGQIKKIKDPYSFFQTKNNKIWHPVVGIINNNDFEYFEDLEDYFQILDTKLIDVGFVRILHEEDSISIHGGIFRNPFIAFNNIQSSLSLPLTSIGFVLSSDISFFRTTFPPFKTF